MLTSFRGSVTQRASGDDDGLVHGRVVLQGVQRLGVVVQREAVGDDAVGSDPAGPQGTAMPDPGSVTTQQPSRDGATTSTGEPGVNGAIILIGRAG